MITFLSICSVDYGQILDSPNSWNYLNVAIPTCKCEGKSYENYNFKIGGDTIAHGKTYKKVVRISDGIGNGGIKGLLREDENHKKIYALFPYLNDSTEVLLYDFTIKKDSVFNSSYVLYASVAGRMEAFNRTFFNSKVTDIDSVEYIGIKRLRIRFEETMVNWIGENPVNDTVTWIEGIGSLQGLLNYNSGGTSLLCFKQNAEIRYLNDYGYDCDYTGPSDFVNSKELAGLSIYPNPFKDVLYIKSADQIKSVTVYGLNGENLRCFAPKSSEYKIQLNDLARGLYIIKVDNYFVKVLKE